MWRIGGGSSIANEADFAHRHGAYVRLSSLTALDAPTRCHVPARRGGITEGAQRAFDAHHVGSSQ
jgi:hypothetical protein